MAKACVLALFLHIGHDQMRAFRMSPAVCGRCVTGVFSEVQPGLGLTIVVHPKGQSVKLTSLPPSRGELEGGWDRTTATDTLKFPIPTPALPLKGREISLG